MAQSTQASKADGAEREQTNGSKESNGQEEVQPEWWHGAVGNMIFAISWLAAPGMFIAAIVVMAVRLGTVYGSISVLLCLSIVLCKTNVQRAVVCLALAFLSSSSRIALCSTMVITALIALLAVRVDPWPEVLDFFTRRWPAAAYYKKCELRGNLTSIRQEKSVLAFHPHGILCCGYSMNGPWSPHFLEHCGKVTFLIDGNLRYNNPFFKLLLDWYKHPLRDFKDPGKETLKELMVAGGNIVIVAGGFMEATLFRYGHDRVAVKKRKGLVKLCLQHGYWLHPVYTFGESETFYAFQGLTWLRLLLAKYNIPTVLFAGCWWCPMMPFPSAELITYVGEPVQLPHIPEPDAADVDRWHDEYVKALVRLFEENKAAAGKPDAKLEVF
mmetsp:Transcript_6448/g.15662  ORF Transcript_6448/g.15662 Transcript_6448/m.15662 type:complete len:384 (+) Transcript_6448:88-1239(+)